ncbi:hypothetical protein [Sphingomonas sp. ID0503]|uniref:hypothetical protein n=1 Tax=Sphingomonas sp. ID0503 TaxID=3399691 RepID=UPI003AFB0344
MRHFIILAGCAAALAVAPSARAGLLDGLTCTLSLGSTGTLAMSPTGTFIGSEAPGGGAATILVVASLALPHMLFSAPTVTGPSGWGDTPTTYLSLKAASGAGVPYTSGASAIRPGLLLDTITVNARVENSAGFKESSYTVTSTVMCQQ